MYRRVQEALTNVRRHAPGADAHVELWENGDESGLTVANSPSTRPSLPLPGSRFGLVGLVGLRERVEFLAAAGRFEPRRTAMRSPLVAIFQPSTRGCTRRQRTPRG